MEDEDAQRAVQIAKEQSQQGSWFDPMGTPTVAQAYEQPTNQSPGIYEKAVDVMSSPFRTYVDKTKEAAHHGSELMSESAKSLKMEDGRLPINAVWQYPLGALGTVLSPLTGAAETIGEGVAQATGNKQAGERAGFVAGFVDPTHVGAFGKAGILATVPMAAKAVEAAKEVKPFSIFEEMARVSSVSPEGNVRMRPSISQYDLKGPETQTVESFLNQVRGQPGITQETLDDIALRFHSNSNAMDLKQPVTKAEFEKLFPSSKYNKVDLKESAENANTHWMEEATRAADDDPERIIEEVLLQAGVPWRPEITRDVRAVQEVMDTRRTLESLPENLRDTLYENGINDLRDFDRAYDRARRQYIENIMDDFRANHWEGAGESGYTYEEYQRLVPQRFKNDHPENYFEIGVTHPDQMDRYNHYQGFESPQGHGLAGHIRGTFMPDGGPLMTSRAFYDEGFDLGTDVVKPDTIQAKPNSMVIEELQSDVQKRVEQAGHLSNIHATLFKTAIQHALENGFETVYYPTAKTIAAARGYKDPSAFAPIYDKEVIKQGLKPLEKIPGVQVEKIGNDYYEIHFLPDAVKYIMKGPGQRLTNYATGGAVGGKNEYASLDFSDVLPYNFG